MQCTPHDAQPDLCMWHKLVPRGAQGWWQPHLFMTCPTLHPRPPACLDCSFPVNSFFRADSLRRVLSSGFVTQASPARSCVWLRTYESVPFSCSREQQQQAQSETSLDGRAGFAEVYNTNANIIHHGATIRELTERQSAGACAGGHAARGPRT
eukprot:365626-Chlamydomonas_euryale.AAC.10